MIVEYCRNYQLDKLKMEMMELDNYILEIYM